MQKPPAPKAPLRISVYKELARKLEERINAGEFSDGRLPSEREIANTYGVSRISVRGAMMMLRSLGLINIESKTRARLSAPTSADLMNQLSAAARMLVSTRQGISDLQEARALFEGAIARYAARHATPKQIERLGLALAENKRSLNDPEAFIRSDMEFHLALAEIPHNHLLVALNNALSEWLQLQRSTSITVRGSVKQAFEDHERVYEAVAAHDADAAERAMNDHLARVAHLYWKASVPTPPARRQRKSDV